MLCTSPDRARLIADLIARNPGITYLLMDLEADDELRAKLEIELLSGANDGEASCPGRETLAVVNAVVPTSRRSTLMAAGPHDLL